MKSLLFSLLFIPSLALAQAPLPVGSISDPVSFAPFFGDILSNRDLASHDGKIVALMYFTPW